MTDHVFRRRRFAGEVPGVEFLEGCVDVLGVELNLRGDPVFGVNLDNVEHLGADGPRRREVS